METETVTCLNLTKPVLPRAQPRALLVHIYPPGPGLGALINLGDTPLVVGRGDQCDIHVRELTVSRRHLCIQPDGDGYHAVDLGSTNGTLVNGRPVARRKLADGDHVQVGNQIFRYLSGANVEARFLEEIYRLAIIDALTGIHNKGFLMEFLGREVARSIRHRRPLSLILFDVDRFKAVNDRLGHLAGDCLLQELVLRIKGVVRKDELLARYGGEEFAVVLPEATLGAAVRMAERLRQVVERLPFVYDERPCRITVSVGVASTTGDPPLVPEDLIRQADGKLYQAKHAGRNCVQG